MTRTNAYTLLCVAIRAAAVYSLVALIVALPGQLQASAQMPGVEHSASWIAALALTGLIVIALLWVYADKFARLALARPQEHSFDSDLAPSVWLGLAISAIGAWHLLAGLIDGVFWAIRLLALRGLRNEGYDPAQYALDVWPGVAATAMQFALGLVCLLRGKGLARWVQRMRYGRHAAD